MLSNKIIFFCVCLASISFAHALVRQRPLIGGFIPIDDLTSDLVKEASHEAIKVWNKNMIIVLIPIAIRVLISRKAWKRSGVI